jgi:single-strand DNA-binding protein
MGNLGRDPEIRSTQDGTRIANMSLATSEHWRDKNSGERKEKTEWHNIVVFQNQDRGLVTQVIEPYLKKGDTVHIEGKLQTRKWEKDGVNHYSTEIVVNGFAGTVTLCGGKRDASKASSPGNGATDANEEADLDSDIPF